MPATLRRGDQGPDVVRWQDLLGSAGHPVSRTGVFDRPTEQATRGWQGQRGLAADGVVGPASWVAMTGTPEEAAPKTLVDMFELTCKYQRRPSSFTPQLLLAIFWEESLFTNVRQRGGGTAIGFGQVEPAELPKLTTARARELGYAVEGVSASTTELPDDLSVTVPSCYLLHLFHASQAATIEERVSFALKAYAGVYYEGPSPLTKERRLEIVAGWRRCEQKLLALPLSPSAARREASPDLEAAFMSALAEARPFASESLRPRLFPAGWERSPAPPVAQVVGVAAGISLIAVSSGVILAAELLYPGTIRAFLAAVSRAASRSRR